MSTEAAAKNGPLSPLDQIRYAREIILIEGRTLLGLANRLDQVFCEAIELLLRCHGSVLVTGMGKAGLIGQKISATLASTGTRSYFLHPGEAYHGDLGRIHRDDVVIILSQSGETEEVTRLLPSLAEFDVPVIAITGSSENKLAKAATVTLALGPLREACSLGLAPSTSTTAMLGLGDALALVTSRMREFGAEDFARFHPGGSLGRKLSKVDDHMRPLAECRVSLQTNTVREVLTTCTKPGRRSGAILLTDVAGRLTGIFTDSDLVRLFEKHREQALDEPIERVMATHPATVPSGAMIGDAIEILRERKISELPVITADRQLAGLIDITDISNIMPAPPATDSQESQADNLETPFPLTIRFPDPEPDD